MSELLISVHILLGLLLNQCGNFLFSLGMNLLKYLHLSSSSSSNLEPSETETPLLHPHDVKPDKRLFAVPPVMVSIGGTLIFVSFAFAPQSVLAALSSTQFVFNLVFKSHLFKDSVKKLEILATGVVIAGDVLVVFASSVSNGSQIDLQNKSVLDIEHRLISQAYIIYLSCLLVLSVLSHIMYSVITSDRKEVSQKMQDLLAPVLYSVVSAMLGSIAMVMAKSIAEIVRIKMTIHEEFGFKDPIPVFFAFALVVAISFWMYRVNNALKLFSNNSAIIPILQVCWLMFCIVGGGIYFSEFQKMTVLQLSLFTIGAVIIIGGVILLASFSFLTHQRIDFSGSGRTRKSSSELYFTLPVSEETSPLSAGESPRE